MKKNEDQNVEYLNCIYKNANMGIIGIDDIIEKVNSSEFEKVLNNEKNEYDAICREAINILKKYGKKEEDVSSLAKVSTKIMSEMKLLKETTDEVIAKMMIEGTNKGIIEVSEKINSYNNSDSEIVLLLNKLSELLKNNIEELKKYL